MLFNLQWNLDDLSTAMVCNSAVVTPFFVNSVLHDLEWLTTEGEYTAMQLDILHGVSITR